MHKLRIEYSDGENSCYRGFSVNIIIEAGSNAEVLEKTLKAMQSILDLRAIVEEENAINN